MNMIKILMEIPETIMRNAADEIPDEIEHSSSRNNLTWIIVNEENSGYYYWGENNMAKMLRSKLFGYINDLDKDMETQPYSEKNR